jgi:hypothetical protein
MLYVVVNAEGQLLCVATCAVDAHLRAKKERAAVYTCCANATSAPKILEDHRPAPVTSAE